MTQVADPQLMAGLAGAGVGLLGAAAGLWVIVAVFRGSFSRFVAVRPDPGIAPVSREELIRRILTLNDPAQPFSYRPDERYDIRAEWRLADASWWGVLQRNHLSETYFARVQLNDRYREVRIVEELGRIEWTAGAQGLVPRVAWSRRFFKGIILFQRSREIAYGIRDAAPLDWGKVVDYDFDVWRIKGPILRTAIESGWIFCPVAMEGHLTANRPFAG